jgi:hypothetical protein
MHPGRLFTLDKMGHFVESSPFPAMPLSAIVTSMKTDLETLTAMLDKAKIEYENLTDYIVVSGVIFFDFNADGSLRKIWTPEAATYR